MKLSLKVKMSILLFLIISVPLGISGAVSYQLASGALQKTIEEELRGTTNSTAGAVDAELEAVGNDLGIASRNSTLADFAGNPSAASLRNTAFNYISGVQKDNAKLLESLIIADTHGKALITSSSESPGLDVSDRAYFQEALQGKDAVSEVILSRETNQYIVAIARPLRVNDQITGVLIGTALFENITSPVTGVKIGEHGYGYMIDRTGLIVSHPEQDKVLKENLGRQQQC